MMIVLSAQQHSLNIVHLIRYQVRVRTARARQDNIRRLRRGRDAGHPTSVAGERADELQMRRSIFE